MRKSAAVHGLIAAQVKTPDILTTVSIMTYDIETYQGDHPFQHIDEDNIGPPVLGCRFLRSQISFSHFLIMQQVAAQALQHQLSIFQNIPMPRNH
jgi:hypothetical protein